MKTVKYKLSKGVKKIINGKGLEKGFAIFAVADLKDAGIVNSENEKIVEKIIRRNMTKCKNMVVAVLATDKG